MMMLSVILDPLATSSPLTAYLISMTEMMLMMATEFAVIYTELVSLMVK